MENKYYTPNNTEFHVGFEFEYLNNDWIPAAVHSFRSHIETMAISDGVRVKYLDRTDIESEGWIFTEQEGHTFINFKKIIRYRGDKVQCKLNYVFATSWVLIWLLDEKTLFAGRIKNISELRRLQKQLGIN